MKRFFRHAEQGRWKGSWRIEEVKVGCYHYANGVLIDVTIALDASIPGNFRPSPAAVLKEIAGIYPGYNPNDARQQIKVGSSTHRFLGSEPISDFSASKCKNDPAKRNEKIREIIFSFLENNWKSFQESEDLE